MEELARRFVAAVEDPFTLGPTDRWRVGELKQVTPPAQRIDDLKTPPLERVAAGEVEQAREPELREDSLPSVMAPEVEDAPTIPAMDPVVRLSLPSMRPTDARDGKLPEIHAGKTDPDAIDAAPTDPAVEATDPDSPQDPTEPRVRSRSTKKAQKDIPTVIVEPAETTLQEVAPQRRGGLLVLLAGVLTLAAVGIGMWLYWSPSPGTTPDSGARVAFEDGGRGAAKWRELWLDSEPSGASVYAESRFLGKTPLGGTRISTERLELLLARKGFDDRLVALEPGSGEVRLGTVSLERRPGSDPRVVQGTLKINTRYGERFLPAEVFLDGTRIGRSPAVRRVRPGLHRIEARRPGFRTAAVRLRVRAGKTQRVVLVLRK
jgi:hypothetical protein